MPSVSKIAGVVIFVIVMITGCVKSFIPETTKYENVLVVDGLITDLYEPYTVRLSRTVQYEEFSDIPETEAIVRIIDQDGVSVLLEEVDEGLYHSDPNEIRGKVGNKYKLYVKILDGSEYESDFVELRNVPPVDELYYRFEEHETADPDYPLEGVQIYLSTHDNNNETWYYRWEWTETWEYVTPYVPINRTTIHRCWRTHESGIINIASSKRLSSDVIKDYPLAYLSGESNRLAIMYSMQVRQYSLSPEAYSFWENLQEINQNMGSLFDPTPTPVVGNLVNINETGQPVLGYFQASAVKTKRLFVNRKDLPEDFFPSSGYEYCEMLIAQNPSDSDVEEILSNNWIYLDHYTDGPLVLWRFINVFDCYDCRVYGSTERPWYWPDAHDY